MVSTTRTDFAEIGESDVLGAALSEEERGALERALDFARDVYGEKLLGTGEPAYDHALGLARNAAGLKLDARRAYRRVAVRGSCLSLRQRRKAPGRVRRDGRFAGRAERGLGLFFAV